MSKLKLFFYLLIISFLNTVEIQPAAQGSNFSSSSSSTDEPAKKCKKQRVEFAEAQQRKSGRIRRKPSKPTSSPAKTKKRIKVKFFNELDRELLYAVKDMYYSGSSTSSLPTSALSASSISIDISQPSPSFATSYSPLPVCVQKNNIIIDLSGDDSDNRSSSA